MTAAESKGSRRWDWGCVGGMSPKERYWMTRFNTGALMWAISSVGVKLALTREVVSSGALRGLVVLVPVLVLGWTVYSFARFLGAADELHRKIHYEAMAWGFAAAAVVLCLSPFIEYLGFPRMNPVIALVPLTVGWSLGLFVGRRRYS